MTLNAPSAHASYKLGHAKLKQAWSNAALIAYKSHTSIIISLSFPMKMDTKIVILLADVALSAVCHADIQYNIGKKLGSGIVCSTMFLFGQESLLSNANSSLSRLSFLQEHRAVLLTFCYKICPESHIKLITIQNKNNLIVLVFIQCPSTQDHNVWSTYNSSPRPGHSPSICSKYIWKESSKEPLTPFLE